MMNVYQEINEVDDLWKFWLHQKLPRSFLGQWWSVCVCVSVCVCLRSNHLSQGAAAPMLIHKAVAT